MSQKLFKAAFSFIELIVALFIASMMSLVLFQALNRATSSLQSTDSLSAATMNIVGFYDRMERDISGAFIPEMGDPELVARAIQKVKQKQQEKSFIQQATQGAKQQPPAAKQEQKEEPQDPALTLKNVQVKKVFVYAGKGDIFETFTLVTCNPMQRYHKSVPRIARVTYSIKEDPHHRRTYILSRKESQKLGFDADKNARSYVLLRNIKTLRMEFLAPVRESEEKENADQKMKQEAPKEPQLKWYQAWPIRAEQQEKAKKIKDLPRAVKISLDYLDPYINVVRRYDFLIALYNYEAPADLLNIQIMQNLGELEPEQETEAGSQGGASGASQAPGATGKATPGPGTQPAQKRGR